MKTINGKISIDFRVMYAFKEFANITLRTRLSDCLWRLYAIKAKRTKKRSIIIDRIENFY